MTERARQLDDLLAGRGGDEDDELRALAATARRLEATARAQHDDALTAVRLRVLANLDAPTSTPRARRRPAMRRVAIAGLAAAMLLAPAAVLASTDTPAGRVLRLAAHRAAVTLRVVPAPGTQHRDTRTGSRDKPGSGRADRSDQAAAGGTGTDTRRAARPAAARRARPPASHRPATSRAWQGSADQPHSAPAEDWDAWTEMPPDDGDGAPEAPPDEGGSESPAADELPGDSPEAGAADGGEDAPW